MIPRSTKSQETLITAPSVVDLAHRRRHLIRGRFRTMANRPAALMNKSGRRESVISAIAVTPCLTSGVHRGSPRFAIDRGASHNRRQLVAMIPNSNIAHIVRISSRLPIAPIIQIVSVIKKNAHHVIVILLLSHFAQPNSLNARRAPASISGRLSSSQSQRSFSLCGSPSRGQNSLSV